MVRTSEIAPDVYRLSIYVKDFNLQFNHFLIKDDEPMLYHAGMRMMFNELSEAVSKLIPLKDIRWIGFSHFEVDECGALNDWLEVAPQAKPVCSDLGAMVNMGDFSMREAHAMSSGDILETGKYKYRFIRTPHLPHGWDAGVMYEETNGTLLCSDLFHHNGEVTDLTDKDILTLHRDSLLEYEKGPLMEYSPYSSKTPKMLQELADLDPKTLATMHGSAFNGNCKQALLDLDGVMKELWG